MAIRGCARANKGCGRHGGAVSVVSVVERLSCGRMMMGLKAIGVTGRRWSAVKWEALVNVWSRGRAIEMMR